MVVAMVKVREMPMSMGHGLVVVAVEMAADHRVVIVIGVVVVVVVVVVFVFHRSVAVVVLMVAAQHEPDSAESDHQRKHLVSVHSFAERQPRRDRADERCGGEHQLAAGRSQFAGP